MLEYISKNDYEGDLKEIEDSNLRMMLRDLSNVMLETTGRSYLSSLEYRILQIVERREGDIEDLLEYPANFFNILGSTEIKRFLDDYEEEINWYLTDILRLDAYCPQLPNYDDIRFGMNGLSIYMFKDVLPNICRYLLHR